MYSKLNDFQPMHKHIVAIDSDGCVFDTMTLKHEKFFYPKLEEELHLEPWREDLTQKWYDVNLYTSLRGINRFLGVYHLLKDIDSDRIPLVDQMKVYNDYVESHQQITLEGLIELHNETGDAFVQHIINWSLKVNEAIEKYMPLIDAFDESRETIKTIAKNADIAVVSSANESALLKEWEAAGLLEYVSVLTSQTDGSKQYILKELISKGYEEENVLMIGDAPGDKKAAIANKVSFRMIEAGNENLSWKNIRQEIYNGGILGDEH